MTCFGTAIVTNELLCKESILMPYADKKAYISLRWMRWGAHTTGDQEALGSIPAGSGNILS